MTFLLAALLLISPGLRADIAAHDTVVADPVHVVGVSTQVVTERPAAPVLRGHATWYGARGMIGAAGPELRRWLGKDWRGTVVIVTAGTRSVTVKLTDWCACGVAHRLIDLSDDAFRQLAPLSRGVVKVVIGEAR